MVSKEYRSWTFSDRAFLFGMAVSILWHLLWFFSITIDVNQHPASPRKQVQVVSLGPVLDDDIFRTLIETRPEFSRTYYRQPSDFKDTTDIPDEVVEKYSPGDVVSMPSSKNFIQTLRQRVGGDKAAFTPGASSGALPLSHFFEISGDVQNENLIQYPPLLPLEIQRSLLGAAEFEIFIDNSGRVVNSKLIQSSNDAEADRAWEAYLLEWSFRIPSVPAAQGFLKANVKLRSPSSGEIDV